MHITSQLIATETGCGIRWASTNANQYSYKLCALGTRAVDVYEESHNAQGEPGNLTFRFLYDIRFGRGLKSPGVPPFRSSSLSGDLYNLRLSWSEENVL
jgi:hypothetical protein